MFCISLPWLWAKGRRASDFLLHVPRVYESEICINYILNLPFFIFLQVRWSGAATCWACHWSCWRLRTGSSGLSHLAVEIVYYINESGRGSELSDLKVAIGSSKLRLSQETLTVCE